MCQHRLVRLTLKHRSRSAFWSLQAPTNLDQGLSSWHSWRASTTCSHDRKGSHDKACERQIGRGMTGGAKRGTSSRGSDGVGYPSTARHLSLSRGIEAHEWPCCPLHDDSVEVGANLLGIFDGGEWGWGIITPCSDVVSGFLHEICSSSSLPPVTYMLAIGVWSMKWWMHDCSGKPGGGGRGHAAPRGQVM